MEIRECKACRLESPALSEARARAPRNPLIDYKFHAVIAVSQS